MNVTSYFSGERGLIRREIVSAENSGAVGELGRRCTCTSCFYVSNDISNINQVNGFEGAKGETP